MSGFQLDVAGCAGRFPVAVDGDVPVRSLLPRLALLAGDAVPRAGPFLALEDGTRLDAERGLVDQGIVPGTPVRLGWTVPAVDPAGEAPASPPVRTVHSDPPGAAAARRTLILGIVGLVELRDATGLGPLGRIRAARRWSDPRRRLGWLIADPVLARSVLIGVLCDTKATWPTPTARLLVAAFSRCRTEEAVLVDGGGRGAGDLGRRRIADQLTGAPRVVILDCAVGDTGLAAHCDQLVDVSGESPEELPAGASSGTVLSCEPLADHHGQISGGMPSRAVLELAAALALDWHRLGVAAERGSSG